MCHLTDQINARSRENYNRIQNMRALTAYDHWKITNPLDEMPDLPENFDELPEAEQKEIKEFMAMTPAQQRRYDAL